MSVWWQKLRQRVEFNTSDQQIMFKNRYGVPCEPNPSFPVWRQKFTF
ncbi:hypothetical protein [Mesomycoplasma ovipneumoniae]